MKEQKLHPYFSRPRRCDLAKAEPTISFVRRRHRKMTAAEREFLRRYLKLCREFSLSIGAVGWETDGEGIFSLDKEKNCRPRQDNRAADNAGLIRRFLPHVISPFLYDIPADPRKECHI